MIRGVKILAFYGVVSNIWNVIEKKLADHSLINVYIDRIESIK